MRYFKTFICISSIAMPAGQYCHQARTTLNHQKTVKRSLPSRSTEAGGITYMVKTAKILAAIAAVNLITGYASNDPTYNNKCNGILNLCFGTVNLSAIGLYSAYAEEYVESEDVSKFRLAVLASGIIAYAAGAILHKNGIDIREALIKLGLGIFI